ncbi:MAG: DUF1722 domain-containing protein [Gammaproteobacteria bacterium]|nr:DUF1722 domain-containing protein [Gammaproteobacteria bacterium]
MLPDRPEAPLKIAVSGCLTGAEIRYDGSGARSSYPHARLARIFDLLPICPETGIGMPVPRPPIRLVGTTDAARAVGIDDPSLDVTDQLHNYALATVERLKASDVSGYVFMKNSPSCGLFRVKVYPEGGTVSADRLIPVRKGRGIHADTVTKAWPELPVEESGRLEDPVLCENFVTRTFAYAHWRAFEKTGMTAAGLIAFHSRYKYLLMAHDPGAYQRAGRLLSDLKGQVEQKAAGYIGELMKGLTRPATRGGHANVLSHIQGYLKDDLDGESRRELAALIESYRLGEQPLLAVLQLMKHHQRLFPDRYIDQQVYLEPHPAFAALRVPL